MVAGYGGIRRAAPSLAPATAGAEPLSLAHPLGERERHSLHTGEIMEIKPNKKHDYQKILLANTDDVGARIVSYAACWAELMEAEVSRGKAVADVAERTGRLADTDGMTGFMYNKAILVLIHIWKHGEELRAWHHACRW